MSATDHIDPANCRRLFRAIVVEALRDVAGSSTLRDSIERDIAEAGVRRWLKSADFAGVVTLAGMDPDRTRQGFRRAMQRPRAELKAEMNNVGKRHAG